jgi:hypothetical protein
MEKHSAVPSVKETPSNFVEERLGIQKYRKF